MFLRSDQIPSYVRIKTLLVYLRSLKFPQANLSSRSTWCFHGNVRSFVSDATWFSLCFFVGFVCEHVVPLCCVTSPGSCVRARELFVADSAVLRLYKVLDGLSSRW